MTKNKQEVDVRYNQLVNELPGIQIDQYVDYGVKFRYEGAVVFLYYKPSKGTYRIYVESSPSQVVTDKLNNAFYHMTAEKDKEGVAYVYVDGSYCQSKNQVGWAFSVYMNGQRLILKSGLTSVTQYNQVAGELTAIMRALSYCSSNNYKNVVIHYDYEGGVKWVDGSWSANNLMAQTFTSFTRQLISKFDSVKWVHTPAHTGNYRNEEVDKACYQAAQA